jgi:hypothetical protein
MENYGYQIQKDKLSIHINNLMQYKKPLAMI